MNTEELPSVPRLSCDSRSCQVRQRREISLDDDQIPYEYKTPKDLPGESQEVISTTKYFPFDEEPVIEEDSSSETSTQQTPVSIPSITSETLPIPPNSVEPHLKNLVTDKERRLLEAKITVLQTFEFNSDDELFYLVQMQNYYGDTFFIRYDSPVLMGSTKISMTIDPDKESDLEIISESMTDYLAREQGLVTLIDDFVLYNSRLYSTVKIPILQTFKVYHPCSYWVYPESKLENIRSLSIEVHTKALEIESVYRREVATLYNSLLQDLEDLSENIQDHHAVYRDVDTYIIEETDVYYDKFARKYNSMGPPPDDADTKRITFLNDTSLKYLMTHSIFWARLKERIQVARTEFNETIQNIYVQMKRDFPNIEDLPIDPKIDVSQSYPGKIITTDR